MMRIWHAVLVTASLTLISGLVTHGAHPVAASRVLRVPCDGTPKERGDALRAAVERADSGIIELGSCTYVVGPRDSAAAPNAVVISGKSGRFQITGSGATIVRFPSYVAFGFRLGQGLTTLVIRDLTIEGEITGIDPPYRQPDLQPTYGIFGTGVAADTVMLINLQIRDVASGIQMSGNCESPSVGVLLVEGNSVVGAHGDSVGYGIATGCATKTEIRSNTVRGSERHGIYHWKTSTAHRDTVIIDDNLIVDHRHGVLVGGWTRSALTIARSNWVATVNNVIVNSHAIPISAESANGLDSRHVLLANNRVIGPTLNTREKDIWINVAPTTTVHLWFNRNNENAPASIERTSGIVATAWVGTAGLEGTAGDGNFYAMRGNTLHRMVPQYGTEHDPDRWPSTSSTTRWSGYQSLSTMRDGYVYVMQRNRLHRVMPGTVSGWWSYNLDSAVSWFPFGGMSASDGRLYIIREGCIHQYSTGAFTGDRGPFLWACGWAGVVGIRAGVDGLLYAHRDGITYVITRDLEVRSALSR